MSVEMSDSEMWEAHKKERQAKRWDNKERSLCLLDDYGIEFRCLDESIGHYRIGDWNFWPTTGKFLNFKTKQSGRGVFNLIKILKKK